MLRRRLTDLIGAVFGSRKIRPKQIASPASDLGAPLPLGPVAPPTAIYREDSAKAGSHIGMQGYAPSVAISNNRRYCEYCGDRVLPKAPHVCWGNAEHHLDRFIEADRVRILAQIASKPKKLTRAQLRKLYASDGLGEAKY